MKVRIGDVENLISILKPECVFVATPWGSIDASWFDTYKQLGYSVISTNDLDAEKKISKRIEMGPVIVYGIPPQEYSTLENLFPGYFSYLWIYMNKPKDYRDKIKSKISCPSKIMTNDIPYEGQKYFQELLTLEKNTSEYDSNLNRLTKACLAFQKNVYEIHSNSHEELLMTII